MSSPYVGELRLVGFNFAPVNWSSCNGQLIAISQNETLYNLIGTTYGGDGQATFALPNLQSRTAIHQGTPLGGPTYVIGQLAGEEYVTLTTQQMPSHNHAFYASSNDSQQSNAVSNNVLSGGVEIYANKNPTANMAATMLAFSGGNQPHNNLQPYLALNWIISLYGIYPTQ